MIHFIGPEATILIIHSECSHMLSLPAIPRNADNTDACVGIGVDGATRTLTSSTTPTSYVFAILCAVAAGVKAPSARSRGGEHARRGRRLTRVWQSRPLLVDTLFYVLWHAAVPHVVFWYCCQWTASPVCIQILFLLIVLVGGLACVGYGERAVVQERLARCGWQAFNLVIRDSCDGDARDDRLRLVEHRRPRTCGLRWCWWLRRAPWPVCTPSAVLGYIIATGYCSWRFSVDYFYAFYPFRGSTGVGGGGGGGTAHDNVGEESRWVLFVCLLPSAAVALMSFLIVSVMASLPRSSSSTPSAQASRRLLETQDPLSATHATTKSATCALSIVTGTVITTRSLWIYRLLFAALCGVFLSLLYYTYELSLVFAMVESDLGDLLNASVIAHAQDTAWLSSTPRSYALRRQGLAVVALFRPSQLVFSDVSNRVLWRVAYAYTTTGLLAGVVCTMAIVILSFSASCRRQRGHHE